MQANISKLWKLSVSLNANLIEVPFKKEISCAMKHQSRWFHILRKLLASDIKKKNNVK